MLSFREFIRRTILYDQILYLSVYLNNISEQTQLLLNEYSHQPEPDLGRFYSVVEDKYGKFILGIIKPLGIDLASYSHSRCSQIILIELEDILTTFKKVVQVEYERRSENDRILKAFFYIISRHFEAIKAHNYRAILEPMLLKVFLFLTYEMFSLYDIYYDRTFFNSIQIEREELASSSSRRVAAATATSSSSYHYKPFSFYLEATGYKMTITHQFVSMKEALFQFNLEGEYTYGVNKHFIEDLSEKLQRDLSSIGTRPIVNIYRLLATPINIHRAVNHITNYRSGIIFDFLQTQDAFVASGEMRRQEWLRIKRIALLLLYQDS